MNTSQIIKLVVSLLLPLSLGSVAGMFSAGAEPAWYAALKSPSFSPPSWVFGPVWTVLYLLMGFSLFLIWNQKATNERNLAILAFLLQLILNFLWTFIFFYFKMIGFALVEIILLWFGIGIMLILFYRIKPVAAYINIPYLLWVTFAAVLNAGYYYLNIN